ncbi:MAG TPA: CHASE2 domain-containing protein, partial [Casimicrobiaceae bacterium]|nr:CHASE2 domain-containing protein [Casimicrobiaceae bacterium]
MLVVALAIGLALDVGRALPLQQAWFDELQRLSPRAVGVSPVTIVEIDERSLKDLGPWPWPRTLLAQLVHQINAYTPVAIGVDIVMPDPDPLSPERALAHVDMDVALLQEISALPSNDAELASAFRAAPTVVVLADAPSAATTQLRVTPIVMRDTSGDPAAAQRAMKSLMQYSGALSSLATLNDAASGWGLVSVPDQQGTIRRVPLVASVDGTLAPTFALEMWRVAVRARTLRLTTSVGGVESVSAGPNQFETERDGTVRVNFSPHDATRFLTAVDVLSGSSAAQRLRGSLVLIGVTARGIGDYVWTPIERMPGVEVHAQLLENMSDNAFLVRPLTAPLAEALAAIAIGALLIYMTPRWPIRYTAPLMIACIVAMLLASHGLFRSQRLLFDATTPALGIVLLFGTLVAMTLAATARNRKALQDVVQRQREESARVAGEMQAAQRIQLDTLPRAESVQDARLDLAASMQPALEVGGDLYDFYRLDERRLFFLLGDVSGKGLPASMFMAVSKALCKSTMLRNRGGDLGNLLAQMNNEVSRDNPAALFVTAFAGVVDLDTGELDYCNAGQENPWLVSAGTGIRRLADGDGPPLCAVDDFTYQPARVQLRPGDVLCVVSDGVTEAVNASGELF